MQFGDEHFIQHVPVLAAGVRIYFERLPRHVTSTRAGPESDPSRRSLNKCASSLKVCYGLPALEKRLENRSLAAESFFQNGSTERDFANRLDGESDL